MKIALVHRRLLRRGGLESRLFSYIDYLQTVGHEVTVIVGRVGRDVELPPNVRLIRVNLKPLPRLLHRPLFDYRVGRILRSRRFEFVLSLTKTSHQDALLAPGSHIGFLKAKQKRPKKLDDLIHILMERRIFSAPGTILACSKMMRDELIRYYEVDPAKIVVLPPPIDEHRFHPRLKREKATLREKYGFHPRKKAFLFVSSAHHRKGLPLLLEVFRQLEGEPLELIVAGVGSVRPTSSNVKYLGFVHKMEELYAAAEMSILPARYEPFGQVVAESIACGTPVMISSMVGAREIVSDREGLIIDGFSPAVWREAIRQVDPRQFSIDPDFAMQKRLRLQDHMERILAIANGGSRSS